MVRVILHDFPNETINQLLNETNLKLAEKMRGGMRKSKDFLVCGLSDELKIIACIPEMMIVGDETLGIITHQEEGSDGKFSLPYDVKIAHHLNLLLVSDHGNTRVQAFDLTTKIFKFKIDLGFGPLFLELDIYGNLLVAGDDMCIYCYSLITFEQVWRRGLKLKPGSGPYQFNGICGIYVNTNERDAHYGDIFISDSANSRIKVLSKEGDFLYMFGKRCEKKLYMESPFGIVINHIGQCVISDRHNNRIYITDMNGKSVISKFGSRGNNEGEFEFPTSVAIDKFTKQILVCDGITNNRVLIFSPDGKYLKSIQFHEANPNGLCINHITGELFIADKENHRVIIMR